MAGFNTHVAGGLVVGAISAAVALEVYHFDIIPTIAVGIMGTIGGLLPDLDSDSGKPLALIFGAMSILIPALLLEKLPIAKHFSPEFLVSYFVISFLFINIFICNIIKKLTRHRGIFHSLPFAVLSGELGYLLFLPSGHNLAMLVAVSLFCGSLMHLVLDELNSLSFRYFIIPSFKSSFGTAIKLKSDSLLATATIYGLVALTGYMILNS
ncbi:metal-dependent hydrolase [Desulforhopalus sp. 52FAK]